MLEAQGGGVRDLRSRGPRTHAARRSRPRDRRDARACCASAATTRSATSTTTYDRLAAGGRLPRPGRRARRARPGAGGRADRLRPGCRLRGRCPNRARCRCSPRHSIPGPSFADLLRQVAPAPAAGRRDRRRTVTARRARTAPRSSRSATPTAWSWPATAARPRATRSPAAASRRCSRPTTSPASRSPARPGPRSRW